MNIKSKISLNEYIKGIQKLGTDYVDFCDRLTKKFLTDIKKEFEYIIRKEIDRFYEDYDPIEYERYGDLYNAYKIDINYNTGIFSVELGPEFMKYNHDVSNSYIYEITMHRGWHGGALPSDGDWHKNSNGIFEKISDTSVPYWRTSKTNGYKSWGRPAKIMAGDAPISRILSELEKKENELFNEYQKKHDKYTYEMIKKCQRLNERYYK